MLSGVLQTAANKQSWAMSGQAVVHVVAVKECRLHRGFAYASPNHIFKVTA